MPKRPAGLIDAVVGARLRACREAARMNQEMAGRVLDVTQQQMGKYETGEDRLLFSSVCELAAAFGRTLEQFVEEMKLPYSNLGGFREVEQDPYRPPASSSEAESAFSRPEEPRLLDLAALNDPKDRECVQDYYNAWARKQVDPEFSAGRPKDPAPLDLAALDDPNDRECVQRYYEALARKQVQLEMVLPTRETKIKRLAALPR